MSREKLKQAMQLLQECMDEYEGEDTEEGMESSDESESMGDSEPMMSGNDKVKMAAALMKRGR